MPSSSDQPKAQEAAENAVQGDLAKDRQLEIELQAFAELLLDIHEYRYREKHRKTHPRPAFDDDWGERKME